MRRSAVVLGMSVYLPAFLFSIGEGAITPVIAPLAARLGAPLAIGGLISGVLLIGQLIGDVPSGILVARIGERASMLVAAALSLVGSLVGLVARDIYVLALGVLLIGVAGATFGLARHALLTTTVSHARRARSLSLLGGSGRFGLLAGPALAALIIGRLPLWDTFLLPTFAAFAVAIVLVALPNPDAGTRSTQPAARGRVGERQRSALLLLGPAVLLLSAIRASKTILVPLWGVHLGIGAQEIAIISAISAGSELVLFYVSGTAMDRYGRLASALPCILGLVLGHALLVFAHSGSTLLLVGVLLGLANGVGSGIVLTLGADIAPREHPARVLGLWRLFGDGGSAIAPLAISAVVAAASLSLATLVMAAGGVAGGVLFVRYVPRFSPRGTRRPLVATGESAPSMKDVA